MADRYFDKFPLVRYSNNVVVDITSKEDLVTYARNAIVFSQEGDFLFYQTEQANKKIVEIPFKEIDEDDVIMEKSINVERDFQKGVKVLDARKEEFMVRKGLDETIPEEYRNAKTEFEKIQQREQEVLHGERLSGVEKRPRCRIRLPTCIDHRR
jgi:protease II